MTLRDVRAPLPDLATVLAREAEPLALAGNAPLALDSPDSVCFVEEGTVEVFAVPRDGSGPRTHLCTVPAGQLLCGAEPDGGGLGLLAVGHTGTHLRRLALSRFQELAQDPDTAEQLSGRLDAWLIRLAAGVFPGTVPRTFEELRPGADIYLEEEGRITRPVEGVVWARHLEGRSLLAGEESLPVGVGDPLPIPEGLWLVGTGGVRIEAFGTVDLMRGGLPVESSPPGPLSHLPSPHSPGEGESPLGSLPFSPSPGGGKGGRWERGPGGEDSRVASPVSAHLFRHGLNLFHHLCLAQVALQLDRSAQRERERLDRKAELDRSTMRGAYARLASVLEPLDTAAPALSETADPLLAACRLVGQAQGITIRTRPEMKGTVRQGDALGRICQASRIRYRRVILRDDWWRRDNGPLVAFRTLDPEQKQQRPVALLPTSRRSYELVDPADGTRVPVDPAVAETLTGDAYMFYPPLPERPVNRWDLARLAFGDRKDDILSILLMGLAGGVLALLIPILTGQVFGYVIPGADRSQLAQITLALIVSALAGAAFQVTRSIAVLRLGGKMDGALQSAVWDRLLALPAAFFRKFTVGDLAERSLGINAIREMLTGNVLTSVLAAVFSVFSFALLFYYSWRLALAATVLVAVLMALTGLLLWLQLRHQRELLRIQGKIASLLFGLIQGITKIRVAGAEARAYARWAEGFAQQRRKALQAQRVAIVQGAVNATYGVLASLTIFAVVGLSVQEEALSIGAFLAFNAAFGQFLGASLSMVSVISSVLAMVPVYERLEPILETVPEVDESKAEPGELSGEIEFSHVSFRYHEDGPPILDDVSFRAGPGEFIALVGPSGAGKSTCLRLILGFEKPTAGSIYFDGQDLGSLAVQSVRRQIGVVLQHGRPMAGSLFSNIVGSANLGIDDAWEAARMAGLEEDIKAMPMGMHTVVSEGAETFSGGQKQRLLIARAIVHRPRIVLFDEATSALDNRTQEVVSRSLERLKSTRVVIAHRLSTILNADRIYVLESGRVVESGTYQELVRRGGAFARLVERQIA